MLDRTFRREASESRDTTAAELGEQRERLGFPRTGLQVPVHLTVVSTSEPEGFTGTLEGTTRDVSRGGCAVITSADLGERARCIARFPLSGGRLEPDTVWAEVRRREPSDDGILLGLEFETPLEALRIAPDTGGRTHGDTRARTVLVVDDQRSVRSMLSHYLADRGFDVQTASDGEEAFQYLLRATPDVLLLDLYLPRLNGHDLLRRMQDTGVSVELILTMSGYAATSDAKECLRLGATDHLLKPLDVEHLYRSILLRLDRNGEEATR